MENSTLLYSIVSNYKGRVVVLVENLSYCDAYWLRSKFNHYKRRSIEVRKQLKGYAS